MPFIARDDHVQIYYEERGSGLAVLLSHGFGATLGTWQRQMDALADRCHLIAWYVRGHGRSDSQENALYSHEAAVADMAAVLDACGVERAVIGGLSLGGFISLAFHLAHPDRTLALMLFDTGPARRKAKSSANAIATDGPGLNGLERARRGMLEHEDDAQIIASLPSIRVPTLVLCGAEDERFLAAADFLVARIPRAKRVILDGAGHVSNLDNPEGFNTAVRSFLDQIAS